MNFPGLSDYLDDLGPAEQNFERAHQLGRQAESLGNHIQLQKIALGGGHDTIHEALQGVRSNLRVIMQQASRGDCSWIDVSDRLDGIQRTLMDVERSVHRTLGLPPATSPQETEDVRNQIADFQRQLAELEDAIAQKQQAIENLQTQNTQLAAAQVQHAAAIEPLTRELNTIRDQLREAETRERELQEQRLQEEVQRRGQVQRLEEQIRRMVQARQAATRATPANTPAQTALPFPGGYSPTWDAVPDAPLPQRISQLTTLPRYRGTTHDLIGRYFSQVTGIDPKTSSVVPSQSTPAASKTANPDKNNQENTKGKTTQAQSQKSSA